jgi:hypothetical protein
VSGPFDLLEQRLDIVDREAGPKAAEAAGRDSKHLPRPGPRRQQSAPQRLVDDIPERAPGLPDCTLELRRHIIIERQRRAHIMMMATTHQDVKATEPRRPVHDFLDTHVKAASAATPR